MPIVKLGEVCQECRETCKDARDEMRIVGLEHIEPECIALSQWGESADNTFTKVFHKGQMLFGRRRAYLKKAALAPFDGVCSGDITVIQANANKLLPELLPFVIQNDGLFDFAVGQSAGSLSPRVKWEHLSQYEFCLPSLAEQRGLADVLWAMERAKTAYKDLINQANRLSKSEFSVLNCSDSGKPIRMGDIATYINGYPFKPSDWSTNGQPIIRIQNLNNPGAPYNFFSGKIPDKYLTHDGDVLISWATHLEAYMWAGPDAYVNQHIFRVDFDKQKVNKTYFIHAANEALKIAFQKAHGFKATMEHIQRGDFEDAIVYIPSSDTQERFAVFVNQSRKCKLATQQALDSLVAAQKALLNQCFH